VDIAKAMTADIALIIRAAQKKAASPKKWDGSTAQYEKFPTATSGLLL
jgi:hypothetical protein